MKTRFIVHHLLLHISVDKWQRRSYLHMFSVCTNIFRDISPSETAKHTCFQKLFLLIECYDPRTPCQHLKILAMNTLLSKHNLVEMFLAYKRSFALREVKPPAIVIKSLFFSLMLFWWMIIQFIQFCWVPPARVLLNTPWWISPELYQINAKVSNF